MEKCVWVADEAVEAMNAAGRSEKMAGALKSCVADMLLPACTLEAFAGLLEEDHGPAWEVPIIVRMASEGQVPLDF